MPLNRAIAATGSVSYLTPMAAAFLRLFALVAIVLMPVGMIAAPASAAHAASAEAGHCPDRDAPDEEQAKPQSHCMACNMLAADASAELAMLSPPAPRVTATGASIASRLPEIATPPPKLLAR